MKKFFIFSIYILSSYLVQGQVLLSILFGDKLNTDKLIFGIHVDYSFNHISGIEPQKDLGKVNLSLFFDYKFSLHWRALAEALAKYTRGGNGIDPYSLSDPQLDQEFASGEVERRIGYVGLLTALEYNIKQSWYVETGPQFALRTKAKDIFTNKTEDGEIQLTKNIKDEISLWEFSYVFGAGYKLGKGTGTKLGFRYNWGISDVQKNISGHQQNRGLYIISNIPIGRHKQPK
jgi:hypothetical protein